MNDQDSSSTNTKDREPTPEEARHELQAILGQLHGLMSKAVEYPTDWCPPDLINSLETAYRDIGQEFGKVQAELNKGAYDDKLSEVGLAGEQMKPKKKGFWQALRQFFAPTKNGEPPFFGALGSATRWGGIIVGSLSKLIPGAEVIKEFIEVIHAAREQFKEYSETNQISPSAPEARSKSKQGEKPK